MGIVKANAYASFKYNQCVRQDNNFQNRILSEEKYNKKFGDECHDIYQALYQKDITFEGEGTVKTLIDSIKDSADFQSLKERTKGNNILSFVSMQTMIPELKEMERDLPKDKPLDQKQKDKLRQMIRHAVNRATEKAEETDEVLSILGIGKGEGCQTDEDVADALEISKRVTSNEDFQKIMLMAGRMQRNADSVIKTNTEHGLDELIGVDASDDVQNVLPEELVDPDLYALKYVESRLQVNKFRGKQPQDKGPIIVCIDESGSMQGFPYHFSRAILFGMYVVACQQNRPMYVNRFSHIVDSIEIKQPKDILNIIGKFMNGGTDFSCAFNASFNQVESNLEFKKADIIFITDGLDHLDDATMARLKQKKEDISLKVISLLIGWSSADQLKSFSDVAFRCSSEAEAASFCEEAFSI